MTVKALGLDIGGAHIKYAVVRTGKRTVFGKRTTVPFQIYRRKDELADTLYAIRKKTRPDIVAVVMTGELADVFPDRRSGVRWIISQVTKAMAPLEIGAVDTQGALAPVSGVMANPDMFASANFCATIGWVARKLKNALVLDIGSTTTDILPVRDGRPALKGATDLDRLKHGELIYTGYLRTPVSAVVHSVTLNGRRIRLCPEFFSIMGDAYLYLGEIKPKDYTTTTPDGGAKTKKGSARRLARLVLSDAATLGAGNIESIARQAVDTQIKTIAKGVRRITRRCGLKGAPVILIGPGRFYLPALKAMLGAGFPASVAGHPVDRIDPTTCSAELFAHNHCPTCVGQTL